MFAGWKHMDSVARFQKGVRHQFLLLGIEWNWIVK